MKFYRFAQMSIDRERNIKNIDISAPVAYNNIDE